MYFIVAILFLQKRIIRFEWWWEVDVSQENSGMLQYCHCKNSSRPSQQIEAAMFLLLSVRLLISCSLNILPASQDPTWHGENLFSRLCILKNLFAENCSNFLACLLSYRSVIIQKRNKLLLLWWNFLELEEFMFPLYRRINVKRWFINCHACVQLLLNWYFLFLNNWAIITWCMLFESVWQFLELYNAGTMSLSSPHISA